MIEKQLGRYALVKMIGRGGMADVWIGKVQGARGFEKIVAIKLLSPDQVDKEEYQRALTDEARVQVHLKHPNIVDVYDLNFEAENPYLVMEYVEGVELREVLKTLHREKLKLPLPIAVFIVSEIAQALSFAHGRNNPETGEPLNIVHRDVSPSNILLSVYGDVKLSDFGIAKSALQSGVTQVGQIKGKFRYMSPEQAEGEALDSRSDVFSLGLVLYECLFGSPAYEGPSDIGVLQMARTGVVTPPEGAAPGLARVLSKMLARSPADRYRDLRDCVRDLSEFLRSLGEVVDREAISQYLRGLDLPRFRDAATARRQAEEWNPETTRGVQVLDPTGRIVTLPDGDPVSRKGRRWLLAAGGLSVVLTVAYFAVFSHRGAKTDVAPVPAQPPVAIKEAPSIQPPVAVAPVPEVKKLRVSFSAEPYAEVSIPGLFSNLETPVSRSLPAGDYTVTFRHAASGRSASARLKGGGGGSFSCVANMGVADPSQPVNASCRSR